MNETSTNQTDDAAKTLQEQFAGVRLSKGRMGTRRTLDKAQTTTAADTFDADADFLGASKKLLNTKDPAFRAVTSILSRATQLFKDSTLPYPEEGVRLIRREDLETYQRRMQGLQSDLADAVWTLNNRLDDLKDEARRKLGTLYNPADYPSDLTPLFRISTDYPNLSPLEYLRTVSPALYEEQSARIAARFDAAADLAEQEFTAALADLVNDLQRKLQGIDDGTEKKLMSSTVDNLTDFFARFQKLNLHSSTELDRVVEQAEGILKERGLFGTNGLTRDDLRNSQSLRADVRTKLSAVSAQLDGLLTTAPRRALVRRPKNDPTPAAAE